MSETDGGYSEALPINSEVYQIIEKTKDKLNINSYDMLYPVEYKYQVVAGIKYKVKIQVDDDGTCIVVEIFKSLDTANGDDLEITCVQTGITLKDDF